MKYCLLSLLFTLLIYGCASSGNPPLPISFGLELAPVAYGFRTVPLAPNYIVVGTADKPAPVSGSGQITVTAKCPGAEVRIYNHQIFAGEYAEVVITPTGEVIGKLTPAQSYVPASYQLTATITGTRDGLSDTVTQTLTVYQLDDWTGATDAATMGMFNYFTAWLAEHQPQLGIAPTDTYVIVPETLSGPQRYSWTCMFFSEKWEMKLERTNYPIPDSAGHTTIALRRRYTQDDYSLCFGVDAYTLPAPAEPVAADAPTGLFR
jgi:hypothetical protein